MGIRSRAIVRPQTMARATIGEHGWIMWKQSRTVAWHLQNATPRVSRRSCLIYRANLRAEYARVLLQAEHIRAPWWTGRVRRVHRSAVKPGSQGRPVMD